MFPALAAISSSTQSLVDDGTLDAAYAAWAAEEPVLAGYDGVAAVLAQLAERGAYGEQDAILIALLRLARHDRDDRNATLAAQLVSYAMIGAQKTLTFWAGRAAGVSTVKTFVGATADLDDYAIEVVGQMWEQIRTYPLHRTSSVAANLQQDVFRRLARQQKFVYSLDTDHSFDVDAEQHIADRAPVAATSDSEQLLELLAWAAEQRVLDELDAQLLAARYIPTQQHRTVSDRELAETLGMTRPALQRRRVRAESQLRDAATRWVGRRTVLELMNAI